MTIDEQAKNYWLQDWELEKWRRWSNENLLNEYTDLRRAEFNPIFGGNARRARVIVARILVEERGVTHEPNMFGDIPIHTEWKR